MDIDFADVLMQVVSRRASDLHLTAGSRPVIRVRGRLTRLEEYPELSAADTREIVYSILTSDQRQRLETDWQFDFAYSIPGHARFRVNAYFQRSSLGAAFRLIPSIITPIDDLGLPSVVHEFWKSNEQALMHHDSKLFARIETGFPLETDQAAIKADRALGNPALAAPRPLRRVTAYVPRQQGFPQEFLALIETVQIDGIGHPNDAQWNFYEHFARPSAGASWKADFYAQVNPSRPFKFALDSGGYATSLPGLRLPPQDWPFVVNCGGALLTKPVRTGTPF